MAILFIVLALVNAACVVALVFQVCLYLRQKRYSLEALEDLYDRTRVAFDRAA